MVSAAIAAEREAINTAQDKKIADLTALVHNLVQNSSSEKSDNAVLQLQLEEEAAAYSRAESALAAGSASLESQAQQISAAQCSYQQLEEAAAQSRRSAAAATLDHQESVQQTSQLRHELAEAERQIKTSSELAAEQGTEALEARCSAS